jgi:hypothetical protein
MLLALSMATMTLYALRPCDLAWHLHRQHGLERLQRRALRLPAHGLRQPDVALEEVRPHLDSRIMGGARLGFGRLTPFSYIWRIPAGTTKEMAVQNDSTALRLTLMQSRASAIAPAKSPSWTWVRRCSLAPSNSLGKPGDYSYRY